MLLIPYIFFNGTEELNASTQAIFPYPVYLIHYKILHHHSDVQKKWLIVGEDWFISYSMGIIQHIKIKITSKSATKMLKGLKLYCHIRSCEEG